jgi:hypothetical protein
MMTAVEAHVRRSPHVGAPPSLTSGWVRPLCSSTSSHRLPPRSSASSTHSIGGPSASLSVPCRSGIPRYKLQVKIRSWACIHTLPSVLRHRTLPPSQGGLWGCHVSNGSGTHLLAKVGSGIATCTMALDSLGGLRSAVSPAAPDLASLPRRVLGLPCV